MHLMTQSPGTAHRHAGRDRCHFGPGSDGHFGNPAHERSSVHHQHPPHGNATRSVGDRRIPLGLGRRRRSVLKRNGMGAQSGEGQDEDIAGKDVVERGLHQAKFQWDEALALQLFDSVSVA